MSRGLNLLVFNVIPNWFSNLSTPRFNRSYSMSHTTATIVASVNQVTKPTTRKRSSSSSPSATKLTTRLKNSGYFEESEAIKKLSNIVLTSEQIELKETLLQFIRDNLESYNSGVDEDKPSVFIINGDAGTGKSVILNSIFNEIQKISKNCPSNQTKNLILKNTKNYLVVNHPEMLKLYHQISKKYSYILKSDLERPTSLINKHANSDTKIDVLIIDEAHLLATSKDAFKRFHQENHLQELLKISKVVIMVFDENQSLRMGSYWKLDQIQSTDGSRTEPDGASLSKFLSSEHISKFQFHQLQRQFRVTANEHILNWIKEISTHKNLSPLLPMHNDPVFQLRFFENCQTMYQMIKFQNSQVGQSRILSTYDFPYRLDGNDYFVYSQTDSFKLRWDRYLPNITTPWSERQDTIDEVGSVYTIQGFDLNFAGVILGRSIGWDHEGQCLKIKPEYYDDHAGFTKKKNINNVDKVKERIVLNSLNVLLTRGVKGLYIYAWDKELRDILLSSVSEDFVIRD